MRQIISFVFLLSLFLTSTYAQKGLDEYELRTFRGTRIINGHSVQPLFEGEMEFVIGHRFGRINGGLYELFGLDQSNIRLGLDYGIQNWLTVGLGRSSLNKELDGLVKVLLLRQKKLGTRGTPISLMYLSSIALNTLKATDPGRPVLLQNRLAYSHQLLIARKFNDRLSIQISPTLLHFNLVETAAEPNDKVALGLGGKYQISKNWSLTCEYVYVLPGNLAENRTTPLSIGVDLNTGSHVFQLHFTNAAGMIDKQFIAETTGNWLLGDIHFGFNMVRTFKLKGRRY